VKLRGLRIEFGEIEYALTEHPQIDYAVVLLHEVTNEDKRLVAYVVPKGQNNETIAGSDAPAILRNYLSQKLPTYMIPNAFIILDHFPLMPNGKIDRNALLTPDMRALAISREVIPPQTATEKALSMLFESILKVEDVGIQDDFFALGGHSLLLTQLFFQLRENFQVDCRLQDLFLMPTITQLANFIDSGQQEKPNRQVLDLNVEAILDPTIRSNQTTSSQISVQQEFMYTKPSSIFLTGATGFLGAFLLYELLGQTQANIFCLVRCMDEQDGMSRLQNNLEQYGLWQEAYRERMNAISGDLSLPLFGLEVGQFNALASKIDVIYHNAALVNLIQPYEGLKSVNVVGTQDIIRLAAQNRFTTPIHYVSTLSVFDTIDAFDGRRFHEEDDLGTGRDLFSGYAQSKWVAEKLLLEAKRRGIPVTIYRPGIISGQSQTGVWNTQDWLPLYLKGWTQLGEWPETELGVYLVPVDYVSSALVTLSLAPTNQNRIFHLENPYPIQYRQFAQWLNDFGYSVQKMSIDRWLDKLTKTVSGSSDHALMPLLAMFVTESLDATKPSMIDIFKNGQLPQFDCSNTLAGLAHTDITCPRVDAKLFQTYLSYYIQTGFLEAPSGTPPNKQVAFNSHQK
jgi:thioester reductase-like protein